MEIIAQKAEGAIGVHEYNDDIHYNCKGFVLGCTCEDSKKTKESTDQEHTIVQCQNFILLRTLAPGNAIEIWRFPFSHWGVYIGAGNIVHIEGLDYSYWSPSGVVCAANKTMVPVKEDPCIKVAGKDMAICSNDTTGKKRPLPRHEIVARARRNLGWIEYHTLYKNCEHFVNRCRYGDMESEQSKLFATLATAGSFMAGAVLVGPIIGLAAASFVSYKLVKNYKDNKPTEFK